MNRYIKVAFFLLICSISLLLFSPSNAHAQAVSIPTIIELSGQELAKPFIAGLTPAGTEVLIYFNGVYVGLATVNQSGGATDNFYYQHKTVLPDKVSEIIVIARDKTSLILSAPSPEIEFIAAPLPAPTMIEPNRNTVTGKVKPLIKGLTTSNTFARVYIDGIYNGKTNIVSHESGTANFAYKPFLNLARGLHVAWAVAEDEAGRKSKASSVINFRVEQEMPAPTIFTPVVNSRTTSSRPFIVGLAKNDSLVKVFIDHKLSGQFQVTNHISGTANFAYQPFQTLAKGQHVVYTTAIDSRGKESCWSNIIYFTVKHPAIAQAVQEEDLETATEITEPEPGEQEPVAVISPEEGIVEGEKIADEEIKDIIEEGVEEKKAETGLIDEAKQKQGKLRLNLIIFIVFLFGVIAWIFWVNRELIKERRAQADKEEEDKNSAKTDNKDNQGSPPPEQPPLV